MIVIQRYYIFGFLDEKKNGEEKGRKHFVKNIFGRQKRGNIWRRKIFFLRRRRRMERENEECIERRKILFL